MLEVQERVKFLECKVRRLQHGLIAVVLISAAVPLLAFRQTSADVLRLRGIVIEDAEGRDRILIGAPAPESEDRIRTSFGKANSAWGAAYPDMEWYRGLDHRTFGMLILDENGHDRVAVGSPIPDPNVGRRMEPSTGLAINDAMGYERSGYGYFEESDQIGLGLDRRGGEAINLMANENGMAGILLREEGSRWVFVGHVGEGNFPGLEQGVSGLVLRDPEGLRAVLDSRGGEGTLELRDVHGDVTEKLPLE